MNKQNNFSPKLLNAIKMILLFDGYEEIKSETKYNGMWQAKEGMSIVQPIEQYVFGLKNNWGEIIRIWSKAYLLTISNDNRTPTNKEFERITILSMDFYNACDLNQCETAIYALSEKIEIINKLKIK